MNNHFLLWRPAGLLITGVLLLPILAHPALATPPDPFSTEGLVATSQAHSVQRPLSSSPCRNDPVSLVPLSLADVVERALCNNPQTREAWANARFQTAQVGIGESAYLPSISLSGAEKKIWTGGNATNQFNAALSLSYVLYDFGARAAALENARQILAAANATQDAAIQSVFLAALQAYYQLFATQAAVESARETQKSAQESFSAAAARYTVGTSTPADKLQAQTALSQALLNLIRAEGDLRNAQGQLANSMGLDASQPLVIAPPAAGQPDAQFVRDISKLIDEARRLRPELAAAEAQVKAARASADAAKADGMPSVSLATSFNRTHVSDADPFNTSTLGVAVTFPLFTGYSNTYRIRAAQEQIESRLAQRDRLSQQVALDVWRAYQSVVTETQAVRSSADLLASATQSERVALGRYKAGVGSFLDLLTAQTALASARTQNIQALYNWHIAKAALAQSIGQLDFSTIGTSAPANVSP